MPIVAPKPAASATAVHPYACAAAALLAANEGRGSTIAATPCRSKGPPCSQASHGLATALQWRAVLPKIRYSLAGQDTRLSPERPGLESRWRKWHQLAPGWMGPPLRLTTSAPLIHLGEVARIKRLPPVPWGLPCPGTPSTLPLEFPVACSIRPVVSR